MSGLMKAINMGVGRTLRSRDDWETPEYIFAPLRDEFDIRLDVCANIVNHKCQHYLSVDQDALSVPWNFSSVNQGPWWWWMNPPYGRKVIPQWVEKAHAEAQAGRPGVALLPAFTGNGWWLDIVQQYEVRFVRGRIHFVGAPYNAPFWSAIVIFRASPPSMRREPA